jgi:S-layer protein
VDNIVGTSGNDTITATNAAAPNTVLGGLDVVDGGAGTDTLSIADTATTANADFAFPAGFTVKNVETLNVTTNGAIGTKAGTAFDISGLTGLTSATLVAAGAGTAAGSNVKAAGTTDVSLTVSGNNQVDIAGGKAVSVVSGATGTGTVGVTGKDLTSVSVKGGGVVTIDNLGGAAGTTTSIGTTLKAVTLDGVAGATAAIKGAAVDTVTVKNQATALATTVTNGTSTSLTVNVDNAGYTAAGVAVTGAGTNVSVTAGAAATTITLNATGAKSNVQVAGAAVTTLNITGTAALTLDQPITTATKIDGSAATGDLTLGALNAATVNVSTGSGKDSLTLAATAKATVATGAGDDSVTLNSALFEGSTINLGAGNDKLLDGGVAGTVKASTATAVTTIDAGDGTDTLAASLINAANAAQFKNFENIDVSSATATALDVELMTGSTITGLTLTGGTGGATVNNVAAGVGLTVSGVNDGTVGSTTIGVKGAATNTADTFAITFAGTAASTATALAPSAVDADKVVVANVETINVSSAGTGFVTNTLGLTADKLQTLTITGDKKLVLTFDGATGTNVVATGGAVKMIDGSAATGVLDINTTNVVADNKVGVGLTVKTGSAKDVITLAQAATVDAGAGDDTITSAAAGGTFTGGAGNDKFDIKAAVATGATEATAIYATITDIAVGDTIVFDAAGTGFTGTKIALDATVTNLDLALAAASNNTTAGQITWFQYGANTYIVENVDGTTGIDAGDVAIKLTGLIDLSNATYNATTDILTIA